MFSPDGVTGNTPASGAGELRFESLSGGVKKEEERKDPWTPKRIAAVAYVTLEAAVIGEAFVMGTDPAPWLVWGIMGAYAISYGVMLIRESAENSND